MPLSNAPENNTPAETVDKADQIKPLKIELINGVRARVKAILKKWGVLVLAGGILGSTAGGVAQRKYRDLTGYDPDKAAAEEGDNEDQKQKEENKEDGAKGLIAKAFQKLQKAKDLAVDKVNKTEAVIEYKKTITELKKAYSTMMEVGDKASFWLPFLLIFLATVILANKAIQFKKSLTERADPVVERNMQLMEEKINELIGMVNAVSGQNFVSAKEQIKIQSEIQQLMRTFETQEPAIEKEILGTTEPKSVPAEPKKDIAA